MGFLNSAIGSVLNELGGSTPQGAGGDMLKMVMALIEQQGGLAGLVNKLSENGLGQEVASWIGRGANQGINAEQLVRALGNGPLAELAGRFGIDQQTLAGKLAQYLPEVVNQASPSGNLPANADDLLQSGLTALAGKLFG